MARDDIIRMARKAGVFIDKFDIDVMSEVDLDTLERFANLIAADEREECAKVVEGYSTNWGRFYAWAIRARGLK